VLLGRGQRRPGHWQSLQDDADVTEEENPREIRGKRWTSSQVWAGKPESRNGEAGNGVSPNVTLDLRSATIIESRRWLGSVRRYDRRIHREADGSMRDSGHVKERSRREFSWGKHERHPHGKQKRLRSRGNPPSVCENRPPQSNSMGRPVSPSPVGMVAGQPCSRWPSLLAQCEHPARACSHPAPSDVPCSRPSRTIGLAHPRGQIPPRVPSAPWRGCQGVFGLM
jgi:hypothetical protein